MACGTTRTCGVCHHVPSSELHAEAFIRTEDTNKEHTDFFLKMGSIPLHSLTIQAALLKTIFPLGIFPPLSKNTYKPSSTSFRCFYNPVLKYPVDCKTNCFRPSKNKVPNSLSRHVLPVRSSSASLEITSNVLQISSPPHRWN